MNRCLFKGRGNPETVISGDDSCLFHNKNTTIAFPSLDPSPSDRKNLDLVQIPKQHPLICFSVFLIKLSVQIKSISGWFVGDKVTGQRLLEWFLFLLIVKQKLKSWPPRDASVKNNLTERLPHCKALKNIITKHKRNLLHDFKGYNWIHQYQKKNITRAASLVHMTYHQPKQANGYFWY